MILIPSCGYKCSAKHLPPKLHLINQELQLCGYKWNAKRTFATKFLGVPITKDMLIVSSSDVSCPSKEWFISRPKDHYKGITCIVKHFWEVNNSKGSIT